MAESSKDYSEPYKEILQKKDELTSRLQEIRKDYGVQQQSRASLMGFSISKKDMPEDIKAEKEKIESELEKLVQDTRSEYAKVNQDKVNLINEVAGMISRTPEEQRKQLVEERDLRKELDEINTQLEAPRVKSAELPLLHQIDPGRSKLEDRKKEIESELQRKELVRESLEEKLLYRPFEGIMEKNNSLFGYADKMKEVEKVEREQELGRIVGSMLDDIEGLEKESEELRDLANKHFFEPQRNVASQFAGMAYGVAASFGNYLLSTLEGDVFDDPLTSNLRALTQSGLIPTEAVAKKIVQWGEERAEPHLQYAQPFTDVQPDFHYTQLGSKDYWIANAGHLLGSIAVFGGMGALAAIPGGQAAAGLTGLAKIAATGIVSSALATPLLSAVYAGDAYREVYEGLAGMGLTEEKRKELAGEAAAKTFRTVLPATFAFNSAVLGLSYGSGSLLGKGGWKLARNIGGRALAPVSSGLDNYHQEWAKQYFVGSATGTNPSNLFEWYKEPEGSFSFYAGVSMALPHVGLGAVMGGGTKGTINTPWGEFNSKNFGEYAKNHMMTRFAGMGQYGLMEAQFQTDNMVKEGSMTAKEQAEFMGTTQELIGKHELMGEAATLYTHLYRQIESLKDRMDDPAFQESAQKRIDVFASQMTEILETDALNNGEVQVLRIDGEMVPLVRGEQVRVEDLSSNQKEHYDAVVNLSKDITDALTAPVEPSWIAEVNGEKVIFESRDEFLDAMRQVDDNTMLQWEVIGDIEATDMASQILAEKFPVESNTAEFVEMNKVKEVEKAEDVVPEKAEVNWGLRFNWP